MMALAIAGFAALIIAALASKSRGGAAALPPPTPGPVDLPPPIPGPTTPPAPDQPSEQATADATSIAQQAGAGAAADTQAMATGAAALNREVAAGRMTQTEATHRIQTTGAALNAKRQTQTQRAQAAALAHEVQRVQAEITSGRMTAAEGKRTIDAYTVHLRDAAHGVTPPPHPAPRRRAAIPAALPAQRPPAVTDHLTAHEAVDRETRAAAARHAATTPRQLPTMPHPDDAHEALPLPPPPPPPPPATDAENERAPHVDAPRHTRPHPPHEAAPPEHRPHAPTHHGRPLGYATHPQHYRQVGSTWYMHSEGDGKWYEVLHPGTRSETLGSMTLQD